MTSQSVDIYSMLNKAQHDYQQQNSSSVAAFFRQASNQNGNGNQASNRSMPTSMPMQINGGANVSSLEQIERQIRTSPPSNTLHTGNGQQNQANSPLAQFFNTNNFSSVAPRPVEPVAPEMPRQMKLSGPPPGFKETKLITPSHFESPNEKKPAEPLNKKQLLQALNYLITNDDEFMMKIHEAYVKSFKSLS